MRKLFLMKGVPGCGKSYLLQKLGLDAYAISSDSIRLLHATPSFGVDGAIGIPQVNDKRVWEQLYTLLEIKMRQGDTIVVDATHMNPKSYASYRDMVRNYNYEVEIVDFTSVPLSTCLERNHSRPAYRQVPDAVIHRMYDGKSNAHPEWAYVTPFDKFIRPQFRTHNISQYEKVHIIGDVHGCWDVLSQYLGQINPAHFYIFLGDYVDRGVQNYEVMRFVRDHIDLPNFAFLEGNHEYHMWRWATNQEGKSDEFSNKTLPQLIAGGFTTEDAIHVFKRLKQYFHFTYKWQTCFACHGGISNLNGELDLISANTFVKGVGVYGDAEAVANAFAKNQPDVLQFHGHRNITGLPIRVNSQVFNLEGDVEHGGHLRVVTLSMDGGLKTHEVKNGVFNVKIGHDIGDETVTSAVEKLRASHFVKEKTHEYGVSAFNFTRDAFYDSKWDAQTTSARGLFIDTNQMKVVARSYNKFFNTNEVETTKDGALQKNLVFPVNAFRKENGYLGITGYHAAEDTLFTASKSTPTGDFADWFREILTASLGKSGLLYLKEMNRDYNVSAVFEVIDPIHDPHIIKYPTAKVVLLDMVERRLDKFVRVPYAELCEIAKSLNIEVKTCSRILNNWEEYWAFIGGEGYQGVDVEGYVFEDQTNFMWKHKGPYYSFWKSCRSVLESFRVRGGAPTWMNSQAPRALREFSSWMEAHESLWGRDIITVRELYLGELK